MEKLLPRIYMWIYTWHFLFIFQKYICGASLWKFFFPYVIAFLITAISFIWFSDGKTVGACLDRNGLRPARYWRTVDNVVYVASEVCFKSLVGQIFLASNFYAKASAYIWPLRQGVSGAKLETRLVFCDLRSDQHRFDLLIKLHFLLYFIFVQRINKYNEYMQFMWTL